MNLIFGNLELTTIGGVGTYLVTVAEQLEKMGHTVTVYTEEAGDMAGVADGRGLRVVSDPAELPDSCDVVYAQDTPSAYALADRYREVPQAFVVHHDEHGRWVVPQLPGVTSATVVYCERFERHARSLAHVPEIVRLRGPVDTRRFSPRGSIAETPQRALVMGNYLSGERLDTLRGAWGSAGIELVERGLHGDEFTVSPETEINECDIVVGRCRVIVEAMACGRAAYVYDYNGGDGWVTPENYEDLEADNFDGRGSPRLIDSEGLSADLDDYSADMGLVNRDLALQNHGATAHAQALVDLFRRLVPRSDPASAPLDELARLTRVQWQADAQALGFEHEAKLLRAELERRNAETAALQKRAAEAEREAETAMARIAELEAGPLGALRRLRARR